MCKSSQLKDGQNKQNIDNESTRHYNIYYITINRALIIHRFSPNDTNNNKGFLHRTRKPNELYYSRATSCAWCWVTLLLQLSNVVEGRLRKAERKIIHHINTHKPMLFYTPPPFKPLLKHFYINRLCAFFLFLPPYGSRSNFNAGIAAVSTTPDLYP